MKTYRYRTLLIVIVLAQLALSKRLLAALPYSDRVTVTAMTPAETKQVAYSILTDNQKHRLEETLEIDFSFGLKSLARFRANVYHQRGAIAAAFRQIPYEIRSFRELGLPPVLEKTCSDLEDMGAKGIILMRFANSRDQGLILVHSPIMPRITPHSIEEFRDLVTKTEEGNRIRVTGTPLWDPVTGAPFALARRPDLVASLPEQRRGASIVTSRIALPLLKEIFKDRADKVNVLGLEKDIGCLITIEDFQNLDLSQVKDTVIIPGRTLAHEKEIKRALSRDGRERILARGPDQLTVDGEMSISMNEEEVLDLEMEAFAELIAAINALGV